MSRPKTERNAKIIELANKGWMHKSIARMMKMKPGTVSMVIWRAQQRENHQES